MMLNDLIGTQTVSFYVSPFVRSKQTFEEIKNHFNEKQVK